MPTMIPFAFAELVDDTTRDYYINNHDREAGEYFRCNWLVEIGDFKYVCVLTPHEGDTHKVLTNDGQIRTRKVRVRDKWWEKISA